MTPPRLRYRPDWALRTQIATATLTGLLALTTAALAAFIPW